MPDPRSTTENLAAIVDDLADPEPVPASGAAAVGAVGMARRFTARCRVGSEASFCFMASLGVKLMPGFTLDRTKEPEVQAFGMQTWYRLQNRDRSFS